LTEVVDFTRAILCI